LLDVVWFSSTGGVHAEAANTQQANVAIEGILKLAFAGSSTAIPPVAGASVAKGNAVAKAVPGLPPTPVKPGLQLVASLGNDTGPLSTPLRWRLRPSGQPGAAPIYENDAVAPFIELPVALGAGILHCDVRAY
jgi:hypothetical protein